MQQEERQVFYDTDLKLEAYHLYGFIQKFPNHFHEYFVIGFMERGRRNMHCQNQDYLVSQGDLILFNPFDSHYCAPINGEPSDYRAVNINPDTMQKTIYEITGKSQTLYFTRHLVPQSEMTASLAQLYTAIVQGAPRFEKEEAYFFLMEQILSDYAAPAPPKSQPKPAKQLQNLCAYMEMHFAENISLDDLLSMTNFSKSYLLRAFTKQYGVSPYRYLQATRINHAKKLLEQGVLPIDVAALAGFSDQSHFSNFFKEFIGLTPKQYQRIFSGPISKEEEDCNE